MSPRLSLAGVRAALTPACSCAPPSRPSQRAPDRGSAAVEIVLLAPVLVVVLLFVVYAGRAGGAVDHVRHAADQGARAASLVSRPMMSAAARGAVDADLSRGGGDTCSSVEVDVVLEPVGASEMVSVRVTCAIRTDGTELLAVASRTVTATSTEIVDRYRAR